MENAVRHLLGVLDQHAQSLFRVVWQGPGD